MNRRQFLSLAAAVSALPAQGPAAGAPNVVLIMADDLGYGDLGCYGQKIIKTPNIDRLAAEGMRFTDAYSGCTLSAPSRSVLMTGKHMGHTSVRANAGGIPLLDEDVTVAEVLHGAGYRTGFFGKWGLGDINTTGVPWKQGFDDFFGYLHEFHSQFKYPGYLFVFDDPTPFPANRGGYREQYAPDYIAQQGVGFISHAVLTKKKTFFLCLAPALPQLEIWAPAPMMMPYDKIITEDGVYRDPRPAGLASQAKPRTAYAAMVSLLDKYVGDAMKAVDDTGIADNTLILFCSATGTAVDQWNEKGYFNSSGGLRGTRGSLYEGGIRTPLIARWKGKIKPGSVSKQLASFTDIMPTLTDLAGVKAPDGTNGVSLTPTLLGKGVQKQPEYLYWEVPGYEPRTGTFTKEMPVQAVRMGNWKAVRPKADGPLELYDLAKDPGEKVDVATKFPAIVKKIEGICASARVAPRVQKNPDNPYWR